MQDGNEYFAGFLKKKNIYHTVYLYFFRDPEYQNFLWNCTRELLKKYIPSDIDKLLDVKVETNNKH